MLKKVLRLLSGNAELGKVYSDFLSENDRLGHIERMLEEELDDSSHIVLIDF